MSNYLLLTVAFLAAAANTAAATLKPVGVAAFFVTPDEASVLRWKVASGELAGPLAYVVRDYGDQPVGNGEAKVAAGSVEATVKLPQGFYEVEVAATQQRFGVVSLPAHQGKADPFFCIDSALSWLVRDDEVRDGLIAVLHRSGIGMSRERLSWPNLSPADGKWNWEGDVRYETVRQLHAKHGVEVLEMFHDAPGWLGRVGKYPDDLVATARIWRQITERWRPTWGALEVWNEPDIFFGANLPADQYVPLVKAVAFGTAGVRGDRPLVGGVMAHYNRVFLDTAAANGMLDCVDAVSFHTYAQAPAMEALVANYRAWLKAHGRESAALWITECGRPWAKGPDRPPVDQDAHSALDIAMKAVEARCCGVARHFPFVYPYFEENQNNFGMMDRRATPLRSMAGYAHLVPALAQKRYLGDLKCDDSTVQRARVFGDDRDTVVVLYTGKPAAEARVKLDVPVLRVAGLDGRTLTPAKKGDVPIPDGLSCVWLDRGKLGDRLRTDTPAARLWAIGQAPAPRLPPPSPIVLRFQANRDLFQAVSEGYQLAAAAWSGPISLPLRAFNLSEEPRELPLEMAMSAREARVVGPVAQRVTLPARGSADVRWEVDLREAFAASDDLRVSVTAARPLPAPTAPLVFHLLGEARLEQLLKRYARATRLPIDEAGRWTPNVVGHGRMSIDVTPDKHWRLSVTFGKGDRWVYPFFRLPDDVDLGKAAALVVRARCERPAAVRVMLWEGESGVGYLTPRSIIPADGQWHAVAIRFRDLTHNTANAPDPDGRLDLDQVRKIAIGVNSDADQNVLEMSEAYVVGAGP